MNNAAVAQSKIRIDNRSGVLGIIPPEHRLPGLVFVVTESVLLGCAVVAEPNIRLAGIVGITALAFFFLFRFFPTQRATNIVPSNEIHTRLSTGQSFNNEVEAEYENATAHRDAEAYDQALMHYKRVAKMAPNHWKARYNIAYCLRHKQKWQESLSTYKLLADELGAENKHANLSAALKMLLAHTFSEMALVYEELGDIDSSYGCLNHAIALWPDDPLLHINLMSVAAKRGNEKESKGWFLRIFQGDESRKLLQSLPADEVELLSKFPWFHIIEKGEASNGHE